MNTHLQGTGEEVNRKRRTHKKSKLGCRNCKLRRTKCDEARPQCKKCTSFGLSCNYDPKVADLQLSIIGTSSIQTPQQPQCSINPSLRSMMILPTCPFPSSISDNNSIFHFDKQSLDRLGRFQARTVLSLGPAGASQIYKNELVKHAFLHPYLMHVVQTITAIHDRYLSSSPARLTTTEIYHWSQSIALFNRKLSQPLQPTDRDALAATAALLAMIAFSFFEASTPEEAWPLKGLANSDLEWLRMAEGKDTIFKIANPLRLGGTLHSVAEELMIPAPTSHGTDGIPSEFIPLYGLDESSTAENNPYHTALHTLAPLLQVECVRSNVARFFSFVTYMHPDFKMLLQQKDPRALLLLAHWYAKICRSHWWIARRALLECQATCLYLERRHARETAIQELLHFPKKQCGLVSS